MIDSSLPFAGPPPDREQWVLRQSSPFDPIRWRQNLRDPEWWPVELNDSPKGLDWPTVDRAQVFDIARAAGDPVSVVHTYVAACVWGNGTNAQGVSRRVRPLAIPRGWPTR